MCLCVSQINASNVVCPVIDVISWEKLEYSTIRGPPGVRGGFNWGLQFKWKKIPEYEQERREHDETRLRWGNPSNQDTNGSEVSLFHTCYKEKVSLLVRCPHLGVSLEGGRGGGWGEKDSKNVDRFIILSVSCVHNNMC